MLRNEDDVKKQTDVRQSEFYGIAGQTRPVGLQRAIDDQLQKTQKAARKVKQLLCNAPANCRFPSEVRNDLRYVFEHGEKQLDVGYAVDLDAMSAR